MTRLARYCRSNYKAVALIGHFHCFALCVFHGAARESRYISKGRANGSRFLHSSHRCIISNFRWFARRARKRIIFPRVRERKTAFTALRTIKVSFFVRRAAEKCISSDFVMSRVEDQSHSRGAENRDISIRIDMPCRSDTGAIY